MDELIDRQTDGRTDEQTDYDRLGGQLDRQTAKWTYRQINRRSERQLRLGF